MSLFRPGGLELTKHAIKQCGISKGAEVLDVGCGDGTSVEYMVKELGLNAKGIDTSEELIKKGRQRCDKLDLSVMTGCELPYPIRSFDAVTMECSLSVIDMQIEALHEAYCILRQGGYLIVSDVYLLHPPMGRANESRAAAIAESHRKREHEECQENKATPSPVCLDGAFVKPFLLQELEDMDFDVVSFEDKTPMLQTWAAELIMKYGSFEEFCAKEGACDTCFSKLTDRKNVGYFLLTARKK
ncbi:MAG: class I SAM-dependent methyltransferase [Oscillospiraceae bacterium]|nr:class I SAM-dependent methyltransferase [Oscillospiraceae bacterium]